MKRRVIMIRCSVCGHEIDDTVTECPFCGHSIVENKISDSHSVYRQQQPYVARRMARKNVIRYFKIGAAVAAVLASVFFVNGFYVKNVYDKGEYSFDEPVHAYVEGDAYNYIINGTYFAGYMALSGALYICSAGLACTAFVMEENAQRHRENDLPSI